MDRDIFEDMKCAAGCEYISDLKRVGKELPKAFGRMEWEVYSAEEIKRLMCYLC